jgi:hypothetical protein
MKTTIVDLSDNQKFPNNSIVQLRADPGQLVYIVKKVDSTHFRGFPLTFNSAKDFGEYSDLWLTSAFKPFVGTLTFSQE